MQAVDGKVEVPENIVRYETRELFDPYLRFPG
jgi:hypothetical protein